MPEPTIIAGDYEVTLASFASAIPNRYIRLFAQLSIDEHNVWFLRFYTKEDGHTKPYDSLSEALRRYEEMR
jgi:hypothetical protein